MHEAGGGALIAVPSRARRHRAILEDEGKYLEHMTMYRYLVGSLIYLTLPRSDICYTVGVVSRYMSDPKKSHLDAVVSRYMSDPKKSHLDAVKRILRYVKGIINFCILYKETKDCHVMGYCDADYTGDCGTRQSTT